MARVLVLCALVAAIAAPSALAADRFRRIKERREVLQGAPRLKGCRWFAAQWGTNPNKKNAFGKCVSATNKAKAKKDDNKKDDEKGDDAAEAKATAACKKQQAADAAKFAKDYKNFGQCVKAAKGDEDDD